MTVKAPITMVAALLVVLVFSAAPALAAAPEAPATREAKSIAGTTAVLHGELNPLATGVDLETEEYDFAYAPSSSECDGGQYLPERPEPALAEPAFPATGAPKEGVSNEVTGLQPDREYTVCVVAIHHALGEAPEPTQANNSFTFKTAAVAPAIAAAGVKASEVTPFGAKLEGTVNPENEPTTCVFQYGPSTAYGKEAPCEQGTLEGGEQGVGVNVAGLAQNTTYRYRLVLKNATGSTKATEGTGEFKTLVAEKPAVGSESTSGVTPYEATLEALLNPDYQETTYSFQYSSTKPVGGKLEGTIVTLKGGTVSGGPGQTVSVPTGQLLTPDKTYYYKLVATSKTGTTEGEVEEFTTPTLSKPKYEVVSLEVAAPFEAIVFAGINPEYQETACAVEYSTNETLRSGVHTAACPYSVPSGETIKVVLPGLTPSATYYYRFTATDSAGTETSPIESFKTAPAAAPVIEGESVTSAPNGTTLEAQVNPEYEETKYTFQYATEESVLLEGHGTSVPGGTIAAGSIKTPSDHLASASVSGLTPNTLYYYRVVASNVTGSAAQTIAVASFTSSSVPRASTGGYSGITATTATLAGTVIPDGLPTTYYFQYGGSTSYGRQAPAGGAGAGIGAVHEAAALSGLEPGTTYHYRIVAINEDNGTLQAGFGEDQTFTTPAALPVLTGLSAQGVTQTAATISATLEPQGLPTRYELLLGATPNQLQPVTSGTATTTTPLSLTVGSLTPGTTYYYNLIATNSNGTAEPSGSFTTVAAAAGSAPAGLPAVIPYQSIAELNAKEAREDKGLPNPSITKSLTRAEKLEKALKACKHEKQKSKRALCEKTAHKNFGTKTKGKKKKK
jgi:phosphodiesterase/alkaline phosphatase D-like protein